MDGSPCGRRYTFKDGWTLMRTNTIDEWSNVKRFDIKDSAACKHHGWIYRFWISRRQTGFYQDSSSSRRPGSPVRQNSKKVQIRPSRTKRRPINYIGRHLLHLRPISIAKQSANAFRSRWLQPFLLKPSSDSVCTLVFARNHSPKHTRSKLL